MTKPLRHVLAAMAPWGWFLIRDRSPYGELIAILLPVLVALAVLTVVVVGTCTAQRWLMTVAAVWTAFGVVAVVAPWRPLDLGVPRRPITVLVANALGTNPVPADAVRDILAADADLAVVPEANIEVHRRLAAIYPWQERTMGRGPAVGVYSRFPIRADPQAPTVVDVTRQVRVSVDGPDGSFTLWAIHLPRPWLTSGITQQRPDALATTVDHFRRVLAAEVGPVVVAGDLNLTDRGRGYRRLGSGRRVATRTMWGGPTEVKAAFRPLLLSIDHVLVPSDWCAEGATRRRVAGSDHRAVTVRVGRCRRG